MRIRILAFIDALRKAGLRPSMSESLDAVHAARALGIERTPLRHALSAALVKTATEQATFETVFDRFFAAPRTSRKRSERLPSGEQGVGGGRGEGVPSPFPSPSTSQRDETAVTKTDPSRPRHGQTVREREPYTDERQGGNSGRNAAIELAKTPFEEMTPPEVEACDILAADMARRFRSHAARRLEAARRRRLDIRRTFRRALSSGGVPLAPAFRRRRPGRTDLVVLCDYSHSVATASKFLLSLVSPAQSFFRRVRLFAFVDTTVEVSIERGHLVPHEPLDLYARSDLGAVLCRLWERHAHLFTRNTLVLVLGDARNNRRPPRADLLRSLRARAKRVIWLNPERRARWSTGDSVLHAYEPACDAVFSAASPRQLRDVLLHVVLRP